jgi:hypothetical protein
MLNRYACPICGESLKNHPPLPKKNQWYRIFSIKIMICTHCGAEIEKRFAHFDGLMALGLMVLLGSSGFLSVGRLAKYVLPFVVLVFAVRWLVGGVFSVYVPVKK